MDEKKLSSADISSLKPKLSKMMTQLYGSENAKVVYEKCQQADPYFNKFVQEVVYDQLWTLPGLTLIEKSLVTITALTTVEKEEQLGIHLQGYLNLDNSPNKLDMIFNYMVEQRYIRATNLVFTIITNLIGDRDNIHPATLSDREKGIIDVVYFVAKSDYPRLSSTLETLLTQQILDKEAVASILRHQMIYCGCPWSMNAFSVLNSITATDNK